jgi:hypothetical protein
MRHIVRGFLKGASLPVLFGAVGLALAASSDSQGCGLLWGSSVYVMAFGGLVGGMIGAMFGLARCTSDQIVSRLTDD